MNSVRTRLTLFTIGFVGLVLLAMGLALRVRIQANLIGEIDQQLTAESSRVVVNRHSATIDPTKNPDSLFRLREAHGQIPAEGKAVGRLIEVVRADTTDISLHTDLTMPQLISDSSGRDDPRSVQSDRPGGP